MNQDNIKIRRIESSKQLKETVRILCESFITVANEFGFTKKNAPSNPAFITFKKLKESLRNNVIGWGLYLDDSQIGFVAAEKASDEMYYLEKLAVHPTHRHHGFGVKLLEQVFTYVTSQEGKRISIGIINENVKLKEWYKIHGFKEIRTKTFEHLPFTVCFLEKEIAE